MSRGRTGGLLAAAAIVVAGVAVALGLLYSTHSSLIGHLGIRGPAELVRVGVPPTPAAQLAIGLSIAALVLVGAAYALVAVVRSRGSEEPPAVRPAEPPQALEDEQTRKAA
jgi:hypothetical protein